MNAGRVARALGVQAFQPPPAVTSRYSDGHEARLPQWQAVTLAVPRQSSTHGQRPTVGADGQSIGQTTGPLAG